MGMAEWYGLVFFLLLLTTYVIAGWRESKLKRKYDLLEGDYFTVVNEFANLERDFRSVQAALDSLTQAGLDDDLEYNFLDGFPDNSDPDGIPEP